MLGGLSAWPYTLDGGAPYCGWASSETECLRTSKVPGLWEVPLYKYPGVRKKLDRPTPLKLYTAELDAKYSSNRAPVMMAFHPPYGQDAA